MYKVISLIYKTPCQKSNNFLSLLLVTIIYFTLNRCDTLASLCKLKTKRYAEVTVWFVREYGKIIHELLREYRNIITRMHAQTIR